MKSRIIWRLTACFAAVLLLFTLILGAVFVFMFREHTIAINRTSMEEKVVSIANTLSDFESGQISQRGSGHGMGKGNGYGAYIRFLDELVMAEVWIVDQNLNMLATGHGHNAPKDAELPANAREIVGQVFEGEITYGEELSGIMDEPTLTVGAPIHGAEGIIGAVLIHSPMSGVEEAFRQGLSALLGGVIAAFLLAGGTAILLSYGFTSPLRKMQTTAGHLAKGDYTAKTHITQRDEIGQLAQTIDLLADHLQKAEVEREALDKLRQDFTANVSHELRTPVAVLRGSLEVLQDGTVQEPGEVADYYVQMLSESRHLERLVNDLLDLTRLQDAQFELTVEEVNLCDVVRDTARAIRMKAQEKDILVSPHCPEESCVVAGDYGRIRQMLLILLDNAVKFSDRAGEVELQVSQQESGFGITVTDHGPGIAAEDLPHVFERFKKINSSQNQTGTGLGLTIAKEIADRHNASLQVKSENGTTQFTINFPLELQEESINLKRRTNYG